MPHPDAEGVHTYLTRVQALALVLRYATPAGAQQILDELDSAPLAGQPGQRAWAERDVVDACEVLRKLVAGVPLEDLDDEV